VFWHKAEAEIGCLLQKKIKIYLSDLLAGLLGLLIEVLGRLHRFLVFDQSAVSYQRTDL